MWDTTAGWNKRKPTIVNCACMCSHVYTHILAFDLYKCVLKWHELYSPESSLMGVILSDMGGHKVDEDTGVMTVLGKAWYSCRGSAWPYCYGKFYRAAQVLVLHWWCSKYTDKDYNTSFSPPFFINASRDTAQRLQRLWLIPSVHKSSHSQYLSIFVAGKRLPLALLALDKYFWTWTTSMCSVLGWILKC